MDKVCPNCGKELPEEAEFCLYCFTDIKNFKKSEVSPAPIVEKTVTSNKHMDLNSGKNKQGKMWIKIALLVLLFVFLMVFSAVAMKACNKDKIDDIGQTDIISDTTIVNETVFVPVTDAQGESVTDILGEQVTSVVEVTKIETVTIVTTTQKQNLLDKLFSTTAPSKNDKTTNNISTNGSINTDNTTETTEKSFLDGIIDSILGGDKESETTTTEPTRVESAGTTAATTVANTTKPFTTLPSTTQATTQKPTTTQKTTTTQVQATPISDFEYDVSGKYAIIKKYVGNDKYVTVPAVIESKYVTDINQGAFSDNSTVEVVTFADDSKRPHLWIRGSLFKNCPNLRIINMPNTDLGIMNNFTNNCPNVEKVTLKNNQYRYDNGCLFYSGGKGWVVRWVAPAANIGTITLPVWSTGFEGAVNLEDNNSVKTIVLHKNTKYFPDQTNLPNSLENIYVDDGCEKGYDINGIAFSNQSDYVSCIYPPQNKTQDFCFPENTYFYSQYVKNPHLKTLRIPKTTTIMVPFYAVNRVTFPNLESVYIQEGHPMQEELMADARVDNIYVY